MKFAHSCVNSLYLYASFAFAFAILLLTVERCHTTYVKDGTQPSNPVLLIPGDGGSRIYGKLNRTSTDHWFCYKTTSDWFTMWLNYEPFFFPPVFTCFMDNAHLVYNNKTGEYSNVPGVTTKMDPIGSLDGCSYLDDLDLITYFGKIVSHLKTNRGYTNDNLKAYSYDWRYTPVNIHKEGDEGEFGVMKQLVEDMWQNNSQQRVVIVTHSLGGVLTQAFFEYIDQEWKDKYVQNWISIGTPLFGAASSVESFSSGYNLGKFIVPNFKLRKGLRSWPSTAWLIPAAKNWDSNPIIMTPTQNFTASWNDMDAFFDAINWPYGKTMFHQVRSVLTFEPPKVNITCVYGSEVKTPSQFYYKYGLPDDGSDPTILYGDGDGTVNIKSGMGCLMWQDIPGNSVTGIELKGVEHVGLLSDQGSRDAIDKVLGY